MKSAIFCGTFDPFTLGHLDVLEKAGRIFNKIYIAVAADGQKKTMLTLSDRVKIIKESVDGLNFVEIVTFSGALSDFCSALDVYNIVRGIRNSVDFVYECDLIRHYKFQNPKIDCVYFMPEAHLSHISSSAVRELLGVGGKIENYVCNKALHLLIQSYRG